MSQFEILARGLEFPEAPCWSELDNCLYWTEWTGDRVCVLRGRHANTLFSLQTGDGPSGLVQDEAGNFWLCLYDAHKLVQVDRRGNLLREVPPPPGIAFRNPCDLTLARDGTLYFSDSGDFAEDWRSGRPAGAVYRLSPEGTCTCIDENLCFPNGLALSPDERRLYVAEHRKNRVLAYELDQVGPACQKQLFYELDDHSMLDPEDSFELGPDGLCIDGAGYLWIAHYGGGKLVQVDPDGSLIRALPLPEGRKPTNIAWQCSAGGAGALFITEAEFGLLYRFEL